MIIRPDKKRAAVDISISGPEKLSLRKVLSDSEFRMEIAKEISRSNRLSPPREFAVIRFTSLTNEIGESMLRSTVAAIQDRIRISDSFGRLNDELAILLPETDREGAMVLANQLAQNLSDAISLDTEITVYPWDDDLAVDAVDFRTQSATHRDESACPTDPSTTNSATPDPRAIGFSVDNPLLIRYRPTPWWKRSINVIGASAGLLILSPVLLAAATAIKLTSPGPVFYLQPREGKDGRIFGILKFRTMVNNADSMQHLLRGRSEQDGPAFKIKDDPRVTKLGKYLRKSCVDELPQLINVLIGQMSLVGPRPLPVHESFGCKAWQRARLTVLPGLTCTWQVRGNRDTKFDDWMRMDLDYIARRSFWFDMNLIFKTALLAILHRGSV